MDSDRFDQIARTLVTSNSRRRVLGGLLGAALGGLLTRLGPEEVGATHAGCRHNGAGCTRAGQCCSGRCAGNNTCQPCTGASQCPAPPASAPCKKRACTSTGKCVIKNKTNGDTCTTSTCQESTCTCQDGTCTPQAAACDAQNCPGCCDGTTCKDGDADASCGSGGGVCNSCDAFPNSYCDTTTGTCACAVDCVGKACGDGDGCGHSCGAVFAPCAGPENCCSGRCSISEGHCVIV